LRKLLIASQKGGVGKTTTAVCLAAIAAESGLRTLLVDADPLGSVAAILDLSKQGKCLDLRQLNATLRGKLICNATPNLDIFLPQDDCDWNENLKVACQLLNLERFTRRYAQAIIDSPAFMGSRPAALLKTVDEMMLVMRAEPMAYRTLPSFLEMIKQIRKEATQLSMRGILLTMPTNQEQGQRWEQELRSKFQRAILPVVVPHDVEVSRAASATVPLTQFDSQSRALLAYRELAGLLHLADPALISVEAESTAAIVSKESQPYTNGWTASRGGNGVTTKAPTTASTLERKPNIAVDEVRSVTPTLPPPVAQRGASLFDRRRPREVRVSLVTELGDHPEGVMSLAVAPDGKTLATAGIDGVIRLWDLNERREIAQLRGHTKTVSSVAFSRDGKMLASGSWDTTVRIWDLQTRMESLQLRGHVRPVTSVAWTPDNAALASGSQDKRVRLWNVQTGQDQVDLKGHTGDIWSVAVTPDGATLASAGFQAVKLWQVATGKELSTLRGHANWVLSCCICADGALIATGSEDNTAKVWTLADGREQATCKGHTGGIWGVVFSPTRKVMATGSRDGLVKLWKTENGQELQTLTAHTARVWSVAWADDAKLLITGGADRLVRLWDVAEIE
jgi:WD40 repeat protein/cellulose biosynthesis protein BcsQ